MHDGRMCGLLPKEMVAVCKRRFCLAEHVADFKEAPYSLVQLQPDLEIRRCPRELRLKCSRPAIKLLKVFNFKKQLFLPMFSCFYTQKNTSSFLQSFVFLG